MINIFNDPLVWPQLKEILKPNWKVEDLLSRHLETGLSLREILGSVSKVIDEAGRPAIPIKANWPRVPALPVWQDFFSAHQEILEKAALVVGRIEAYFDQEIVGVGTGWLIDRQTVVTNRHVALAGKLPFVRRKADGSLVLTRRTALGTDFGVRFQLGKTLGRDDNRAIPITAALYAAPDEEEDVAFFRLGAEIEAEFAPLDLAGSDPDVGTRFALIGYPGEDSEDPSEKSLVRDGGPGIERISGGLILDGLGHGLGHDASTLDGSSGSPLIDPGSGKVLGMHYDGTLEKTKRNWAVSATAITHHRNLAGLMAAMV